MFQQSYETFKPHSNVVDDTSTLRHTTLPIYVQIPVFIPLVQESEPVLCRVR
jgi:hypothetical protein